MSTKLELRSLPMAYGSNVSVDVMRATGPSAIETKSLSDVKYTSTDLIILYSSKV